MYEQEAYQGDFYYRANPALSYIRILHASPDAPPVDIYANGNILARGLAYRGFTPYMPIAQGEYTLTLFPAGQTGRPILSTRVDIPAGRIQTIAAINRLEDIALYTVPDPSMTMDPLKAFLRFVHLSPNTPAVDITLPDGTRIFRNVGYKGVTHYIPVDGGTYTLEARTAGTENVILHVPNIHLRPGRAYSVYAVGLLRGNPPLQVLIPLDGSSYIKF